MAEDTDSKLYRPKAEQSRLKEEDSDAGEEVRREETESQPVQPPAGAQSDYKKLDPAAILLWRIEGATATGIPLLGTLIGGTVLWRLTPTPWWAITLVWLGMLVLLVVNSVWLPSRRYRSWSYRLDDRVLELRHGVFWHTSVMIPLSRLQHVDLSRGPLDRRFGVASLDVYTAGTKSASHKIPFLPSGTGLQLRERLVEAAGLLPE